MSIPTAACCAVTLQQKQEPAIHHQEQCCKGAVNPCKAVSKFRTVVENGRVVVKPIEPLCVDQIE